jgi:hypothetical protein
MRTSANAVAVENKAVTTTTKHVALFVKRKRFASMIALPYAPHSRFEARRPFTSHQELTAFGSAV